MSAMVTGTVVSKPCTTMPSESPTSTRSVPASSTAAAKLASYAVRQAMFTPSAFILRRLSRVTGGSARVRSWRWLYIVMLQIPAAPRGSACTSDRQTSIRRRKRDRIVILAPAFHAADALQKIEIVLIPVHRIDARGVDDQQRPRVVTMKVIEVGLGQSPQVVGTHHLLIGDAASPDTIHQRLHGRLEVDDQVRGRRVERQALIDLLVEAIFLVRQGEAGENPVLVQQEISHAPALEEIRLAHLLRLAGALEKKMQLGRQRIGRRVAIKTLEERIFLGAFQHEFELQGFGQTTGQRRLAHTNGALDGDITQFTRHQSSSLRRSAFPIAAARLATRAPSGKRKSGATWASGHSTKARSLRPGCGKVSVPVCSRRSPYNSRSRSSTRGPQRDPSRRRPCRSSMACKAASRAVGASVVKSPATALTKSGC